MSKTFYFDTYALIEIGKDNPSYIPYEKGVKIMLNKLNLLELMLFLIRENREHEIDEKFAQLSKFNIDYDDEILKKVAQMKHAYAKERLSYIDCIGYQIAKKHKVKFLTGDEKFKNKENVEFVK